SGAGGGDTVEAGALTPDGAVAGADDALTIDPETGLPVGGSGPGGSDVASGSVSTQVARPAGGSVAFGVLAAAELLAIVLVPGLLAVRARRRAAL
ncbi:hypothetical protein, partial [uncultured Cellulomonas sp.]|uniref:hypothetical protein n=1 Tax=uncultured Cellulomonas sp. TaxID=189682 RepID=UPI0028EF820B